MAAFLDPGLALFSDGRESPVEFERREGETPKDARERLRKLREQVETFPSTAATKPKARKVRKIKKRNENVENSAATEQEGRRSTCSDCVSFLGTIAVAASIFFGLRALGTNPHIVFTARMFGQ